MALALLTGHSRCSLSSPHPTPPHPCCCCCRLLRRQCGTVEPQREILKIIIRYLMPLRLTSSRQQGPAAAGGAKLEEQAGRVGRQLEGLRRRQGRTGGPRRGQQGAGGGGEEMGEEETAEAVRRAEEVAAALVAEEAQEAGKQQGKDSKKVRRLWLRGVAGWVRGVAWRTRDRSAALALQACLIHCLLLLLSMST